MSTRRMVCVAVVVAIVATAVTIVASEPDTAGKKFRPRERGGIERHYIVALNRGVAGLPGQASKAGSLAAQLAARYGGRVDGVFKYVLNGFSVEMSESEARKMSEDPAVAFIEQDGDVEATGSQSNAPWGLDRIDQTSLPLNGTFSYRGTGAYVHVYVVDSGVRTSHNEFGGRAETDLDLGNDGMNGYDCTGHGTAVASIIGGATYGVAKEAEIHSVRIFDCDGHSSVGNLTNALDWIATYHQNPAVINISVGIEGNQQNAGAIDTAVNDVVSYAGVPVVVSADNGNTTASSYTPARVAAAVTVGAVDSTDTRWYDTSSYASNYGSAIDIWAPGVSIPVAVATSDSATGTFGATSAAAPHVTGVIALYLENHAGASPAHIHDAVVNGASNVTINDAGSGSPNHLLNAGWVAPDIMYPGDYLYENHEVTSEDGNYHFYYQNDGNLVFYDSSWSPIWWSGTQGTVPGVVVMESTGNLVMYDGYGQVRFSTGTQGHISARLKVDDGMVYIRTADDNLLWAVW
jgi:subtilisin family serine protease